MHPYIEQLFRKIGIKDYTELKPDERITYDQLMKDLKERTKPITTGNWEMFLEFELEKTIQSFDPDASEKKKDFLWSQICLIQKLLIYIKSPKRAEEQIKKEYNIE